MDYSYRIAFRIRNKNNQRTGYILHDVFNGGYCLVSFDKAIYLASNRQIEGFYSTTRSGKSVLVPINGRYKMSDIPEVSEDELQDKLNIAEQQQEFKANEPKLAIKVIDLYLTDETCSLQVIQNLRYKRNGLALGIVGTKDFLYDGRVLPANTEHLIPIADFEKILDDNDVGSVANLPLTSFLSGRKDIKTVPAGQELNKICTAKVADANRYTVSKPTLYTTEKFKQFYTPGAYLRVMYDNAKLRLMIIIDKFYVTQSGMDSFKSTGEIPTSEIVSAKFNIVSRISDKDKGLAARGRVFKADELYNRIEFEGQTLKFGKSYKYSIEQLLELIGCIYRYGGKCVIRLRQNIPNANKMPSNELLLTLDKSNVGFMNDPDRFRIPEVKVFELSPSTKKVKLDKKNGITTDVAIETDEVNIPSYIKVVGTHSIEVDTNFDYTLKIVDKSEMDSVKDQYSEQPKQTIFKEQNKSMFGLFNHFRKS